MYFPESPPQLKREVKAALIINFILTIDQRPMCNVKGVAHVAEDIIRLPLSSVVCQLTFFFPLSLFFSLFDLFSLGRLCAQVIEDK